MVNITKFLFLVSVLILNACNSNQSSKAGAINSADNEAVNATNEVALHAVLQNSGLISIAKLSCGIQSCPVSKVVVSLDYEIFRQVDESKFTRIASLDANQQKELTRLIQESTLERVIADIVPGKLGCKQYRSDAEDFEIEYSNRKLKIYDGCQSKPSKVEALFVFLKNLMDRKGQDN